jgi:uncharacterized RDD family membrane protein YckC
MAASATEQLGPRQFCSECGRAFAPEDLARFGAVAVCSDCKPNYVQRLREGAALSSGVVYGGFWRRFAAILVDGILVNIFALPLRMGLTMFGINSGFGVAAPGRLFQAMFGLSALIGMAVQMIYYVYFISQKGATLGKMLLGVKVVTATGGPISVGRAIGRYFAQTLSGLILGIGFIMAAFDDQKRALHDHICSTRVIRD